MNNNYQIGMLDDIKMEIEARYNNNTLLDADSIRAIAEELGLMEQYYQIEASIDWKDEGVRAGQIIADIEDLKSIWSE